MESKKQGLSLKRPVSVWNKPIRIRPRETLAGLAKAAVNGWKGELDDAFEGLADAFVGTDLEDDAGQLAWTLIYAALMRAVGDLLKDSLDLFEEAQLRADTGPPDQAELDRLADVLDDHLAHCEAGIDAAFFRHPERFGLLEDFRPGFEHWLRGLGLDEAAARALGQRLSSQFPLALHEEWRRRPEGFQPILKALDSPFAAAEERQRQWHQYSAWLDAQIDQRMFGEAFGLRRVYVPLRAYYEERRPEDGPANDPDDAIGARPSPLAHRRSPDDRRTRIVVDLHQHLHSWVDNFDPDDTVRLISGGPGSGKSSFARMFASECAAERALKVLFIPLHLLTIRDDLVRAVGQYAEADRWLRGNPLDGDGEHRLLVIFDGLDELSMQGASAAEAAQSFVEQVLRLAGLFAAQNMARQFIITGRDLAIQANAGRLHRPEQVLHVLPFRVDTEDPRVEYLDPDNLLESDQRHLWWQRYGAASGLAFKSMPEDLCGEDLVDITRQPLLNYLVALSQRLGNVSFGSDTNLNTVYAKLLEGVFKRDYEGRRHAALSPIRLADFERLLEEIALAIWHGSGRTATDAEISQRCARGGLGKRLEAFRQGAEKGVTRLLTTFYFRQASELGGEKTFEFTHKSFGEYLTARRLVRGLQRIQTQIERHREDAEDGWDPQAALLHLAEVAGPTRLDEYIATFLRREVRREADNHGPAAVAAWQHTLARLIESTVSAGLPMQKLGTLTYPEMARRARNADETLLVLHGACARVTGRVEPIAWPEPTSFGTWLKRLQGQRADGNNPLCLWSLDGLHLDGQVIDFADLYEANLRGAKLCQAVLIGANLREADLRGADLHGANLREADLRSANLHGADLHGADLHGANLRGAVLSGANLSGSDLRGADLREAIPRENLQTLAREHPDLFEGARFDKPT